MAFCCRRFSALCILLYLPCTVSFSFNQPTLSRRWLVAQISPLKAARYGPTPGADEGGGNQNPLPADAGQEPSDDGSLLLQSKNDFRKLVHQVMSVSDEQHIPSLLTKNIELILNLSGHEGVKVIESILEEAREEAGEEMSKRMEDIIDIVISFAEDFVDQAADIDDNNKRVLGKIILTLSDKEKTSREREEAFEDLLEKERESFTPGFLRHVDGECERIAGAPKMTPESSRLLEMMRTIQARVVEELGKDLGEAAQVLGQLIGFDSKSERLAVLEAGLTVRGLDFARELLSLSEEALDGFDRVNADPELVGRVQEIRDRLRSYIEKEEGFQ